MVAECQGPSTQRERGDTRRPGDGLALVAFAACALAVASTPSLASAAPPCLGKEATIVGTGHGDFLRGTRHADVIVGRGGADLIQGRRGMDRICGGGGADVLEGGEGDDRLAGGRRNDFFPSDDGGDDDRIDGGGGEDEINYNDSPKPLVADLRTGVADAKGKDRLRRIEDVIGTQYSDVLIGNGADNTLGSFVFPEFGSDDILGMGGDDFIQGTDFDDAADIFGFGGLDGGSGDDRISGSQGDDTLRGGRGDDELDGGEGNENGGGDVGDAGEGGETVGDSCTRLETALNCELFP
jgi:Ca2+-binding RTX toxin-like protein